MPLAETFLAPQARAQLLPAARVWLLGSNAAERDKKICAEPSASSHNGTTAPEDAVFLVGCEQVFARIFWRLLRVQRKLPLQRER